MKLTIYFSLLKALRKQDAKADETEELMKNKLVKYESEKNQVRLNFLLSCLVLSKCMVSYVTVYASFFRETSRIKLPLLFKITRVCFFLCIRGTVNIAMLNFCLSFKAL